MTTTVMTKGGGAQPVRADTSGLTTGPIALRAYGFASAATAAAAAGFVAEGGPAMSVYVVSAAELASGKFILDGDPAALPVYTAPTTIPLGGPYFVNNYPVEGGLAQPIYLVGGSLT